MEFSGILGFLKILGKSLKLVLKNGKSIASITTISLLLSSILTLLFIYLYPSVLTFFTNSFSNSSSAASTLQFIIFFAFLVSLEFGFIYAYFSITRASGVAATIATATSHTGTKLSLRDLFSTVKTRWRRPFMRANDGGLCRNPMQFLLFVASAAAIVVAMSNPNPVTITIVSVVVVSFFVYRIYSSIAWTLSAVISVVEDGCEAAEALEKGEKLVQGQKLHGFMLNLFLYLLSFIAIFSFWKFVGDKGSLNLMVYGLFFVNLMSLTTIFVSVVNTVYYFQCMEYHGETIQPLGNSLRNTLLAPNDSP